MRPLTTLTLIVFLMLAGFVAVPVAAAPDEAGAAAVQVGKVALEPADVGPLQEAVDGGHQPWRLDPLEVVRAAAPLVGLGGAEFGEPRWPKLGEPADGGRATVRVTQGGQVYEVEVVQPGRHGPEGVWVVTEVRQA